MMNEEDLRVWLNANLMGIHEIGERIAALRDEPQLSRQRIHSITRHRDFPRPAVQKKMGALWLRDEVEEFLARERPPGVHPGETPR